MYKTIFLKVFHKGQVSGKWLQTKTKKDEKY